MERKADYCHKEMESDHQASPLSINGNNNEGLNALKNQISCHSLFGLLLKSHLDCLKVCLGKIDNDPCPVQEMVPIRVNNNDDLSELDQFMEAYCVTLKKVKEVMEEPQEESMEFINYMYSQLEDILMDRDI